MNFNNFIMHEKERRKTIFFHNIIAIEWYFFHNIMTIEWYVRVELNEIWMINFLTLFLE